MVSLEARIDNGAFSLIGPVNSATAASRSPIATTRLTRPIEAASAALSRRAVMRISLALAAPTTFTRLRTL